MRQEKHDRRSLRTRRLVSSALMDLLLEKRFDTLTVQDLLDRAGIGRSTFYAHYFDKEDVLASVAEQMLETFRQQTAQRDVGQTRHLGVAGPAGQGAQTIVPSLALFRHVHAQYPQFRALVRGHAGEVLWESGQMLLSRNIAAALIAARPDGAPLAVLLALAAQYLAGAFLTLFKWWLEAEMPYTPEEMDRMFQQLALPTVRTLLEEGRDA